MIEFAFLAYGWGAGLFIALAATVASAGLSYALAPSQPDADDYGNASKTGSEAEAETLADRRRLEMAARLGVPVTGAFGPTSKQRWEETFVKIPDDNGNEKDGKGRRYIKVPYDPADFAPGGQYADIPIGGDNGAEIVHVNRRGVRPTEATVDFTGYSDADVAGKIAKQSAGLQLERDRKYNTDFISLLKEQQALADPESTEGRGILYDAIMADIDQADKAERPMADLLEKQLLSDVELGKGINADASGEVAKTLASRRSGVDLDGMSQTLMEGQLGLSRLNSRTQKGQAFLTSGTSAEDTAYRRDQQGLANMAAFLNGQTPVAQFQNLSGAQSGATPFPQGPSLPNYTGQIANAHVGGAQTNYNLQNQAAANQVNPWYAGLSLAINGASAAGQAGWKPLGG